MSGKYFDIKDDVERSGRWFLRGPHAPDGTEVYPASFTRGTRVEVSNNLIIPQRVKGEPLDFTFADCEMPVVSRWIAEAILSLAPDDVQMVPVKIEGRRELYYIMNVLAVEDCFDHETSKFDLWTEADNNPTRIGEIFGVYTLRILKDRVKNKHILRITEWGVPVIVSEELKGTLENATGIFFDEV